MTAERCTVIPAASAHRCTVLPVAPDHRCIVLPVAPAHRCTVTSGPLMLLEDCFFPARVCSLCQKDTPFYSVLSLVLLRSWFFPTNFFSRFTTTRKNISQKMCGSLTRWLGFFYHQQIIPFSERKGYMAKIRSKNS